jgi:ribosomal protein S27AE
MTASKQCAVCRKNVVDEGAKYCGHCGSVLAESSGVRQHFEGASGNFVAAPHSVFNAPVNLGTVNVQHGAAAAALDLSPSFVSTALVSNRFIIVASHVSSSIGLISGLFGIFGTDIFKLMSLTGWVWGWLAELPLLWIAFGFLLFGGMNYLLYFWNVRLGKPAFDRWPFVRDDRLNWIVVRRVCPRCRGTMAPKKSGPEVANTAGTTVWECSRNPDHKLPFDITEVEDALSDGKLDHLRKKAE